MITHSDLMLTGSERTMSRGPCLPKEGDEHSALPGEGLDPMALAMGPAVGPAVGSAMGPAMGLAMGTGVGKGFSKEDSIMFKKMEMDMRADLHCEGRLGVLPLPPNTPVLSSLTMCDLHGGGRLSVLPLLPKTPASSPA